MLSQLIVVDFAKGKHPVVYDELTRAFERDVSYNVIVERPEFDLHLFNYDKYYTHKAATQLVIIHPQIPLRDHTDNPWITHIDLAYRRLLTADLVSVKHEGVYTHCDYKCEAEQPAYTRHLDWVNKTL